MPLTFTCPACQETLQLGNPSMAGKRVRCPKCREVVTAPAAQAEPVAAELVPELLEPEPSPAPRSSGVRGPDRPARRAEADDRPTPRRRRDEDEDGPRPRRRRGEPEPASGSGALVWILVGAGALLLVIGGVVTAIIVIANNSSSPGGTTTPAAQGGKDGGKPAQRPTDGPHVEVMLGANNYRKMGPNLAVGRKIRVRGEISLASTRDKKVLVQMAQMHFGLQPPVPATELTRDFIADRKGAEDKYRGNRFPQYEVDLEGVVTELQPGRYVVILEGAEGGGLIPRPVTEQGNENKIYDLPAGGLTLTDRLLPGDARDPQRQGWSFKVYQVKMTGGKKYVIRMNDLTPLDKPGRMDPYLRLMDSNGNLLATNDDAPGEGTLNSRIDFPCPRDGVYRVMATTLGPNQTGPFEVPIRLGN